MVWTGSRQKEVTIPLKTKKKDEAIRRGKMVSDNADNIKDGTIQRFQFDEYFAFNNDKGTSELIEMTLDIIIPISAIYLRSNLNNLHNNIKAKLVDA